MADPTGALVVAFAAVGQAHDAVGPVVAVSSAEAGAPEGAAVEIAAAEAVVAGEADDVTAPSPLMSLSELPKRSSPSMPMRSGDIPEQYGTSGSAKAPASQAVSSLLGSSSSAPSSGAHESKPS